MKRTRFAQKIGKLDRRRVEGYLLSLVDERDLLERVFDQLSEGVIITDPGGRLLFSNRSARAILGLPEGGSVRRPLLPQVREEEIREELASLLGGEGRVLQKEVRIASPRRRILLLSSFPLREEKEEPSGRMTLLQDVTGRLRRESESARMATLEAIATLAAGIAHEVGNPLNSLDIHLQLIERKIREVSPERRGGLAELLKVCKEEVRRLDYIVRQFLRSVRPIRPVFRLDDLNTVLRSTLDFLSPEIAQRHIRVEESYAKDLPRMLIDAGQLKQAFFNLIRNAVQAMGEGGVLSVSTGREGGEAVVAFRDDGCGFEPGMGARIFRPYFTTRKEGSGLGLMIVQNVVSAHGGRVEVKSRPGEGALFTLWIPIRLEPVRLLTGGGGEERNGASV